MPFYQKIREATDEESVKVLQLLHKSLSSISRFQRRFLPRYALSGLKADLLTFKRYSDLALAQDMFKELFENVGIVHGDWRKDQIIVSEEGTIVLDFAKSFIGPRILDYADGELGGVKQKYSPYSFESMEKAKILTLIRRVAWFDLCKRKYINYSYEKEIADAIRQVAKSLKGLEV